VQDLEHCPTFTKLDRRVERLPRTRNVETALLAICCVNYLIFHPYRKTVVCIGISRQYSTVSFLAQSAYKVVRQEPNLDDGQEALPNVIEKAFLPARSQWIDEPVSAQWAAPEPRFLKTLQDANLLYHQWTNNKPSAFYPFCDKLWMEAADLLREVGLPWHNSNVNMREDIDQSWPFHFKAFER
jgi:hypothetical protein